MTWPDYLKQIKERAEKAAGARSDDFGHSVTDCAQWQANEMVHFGDYEIPRLIVRIEELTNTIKTFKWMWQSKQNLSDVVYVTEDFARAVCDVLEKEVFPDGKESK